MTVAPGARLRQLAEAATRPWEQDERNGRIVLIGHEWDTDIERALMRQSPSGEWSWADYRRSQRSAGEDGPALDSLP